MKRDTHSDPGIKRARENIGALKSAIRKERNVLADYKDRLATGRGGFPESGLQHGIERCEHNLGVIRDAILREKDNIREMEGQAKIREDLAKLHEGFEIPVDYECEED